MQWADWQREDGVIYVASRGPEDGNGGITAIENALQRCVPNTVFVHKSKKNGRPYIVVTANHRATFVEENLLDQTVVDRGRWLSAAVIWFGLHGDWKNCDMYEDLLNWVRSQNNPAANTFAMATLQDKYTQATLRYDQGWAAMCQINSQVAGVVYKEFEIKPRPIIINDFDNCMVPQFLTQMNPNLAEWILYMKHTPVPVMAKDTIPPFYAKYFRATWEGILGSGIRFVGLHTPQYRRHFGQFAEDLGGYTFDESVMLITHASGRITRLGQTLAGVDSEFFHQQGTPPAVDPENPKPSFLVELTGHDWMEGMKYVSKTDRMDDPEKNGRRFIETVDLFFSDSDNQDMKGKMVFLVIGFPSRQGIAKYDDYLTNCEKLIREVNDKHRIGKWEPIVWLRKVYPSSTIARVYGHPDCLGNFVASKDDGLHLGGFEGPIANWWKLNTPGAPPPPVFWQTDGTGGFVYLGNRGVVYLNSRDPAQMARALRLGIKMSPEEKRFRLAQLLIATAEFDINSQLDRILWHAGLPLPGAETIDLHTMDNVA